MRDIKPEMAAELASGNVSACFLFEMFFDSGTLRLWTGTGQLVHNEEIFYGSGSLLEYSPADETQDLEAKGMLLTLSGVTQEILAVALGELTLYRKIKVYLGSYSDSRYIALEDDNGRIKTEDGTGYIALETPLLSDPILLFNGLMDIFEYSSDGKNSTIKLRAESILLIGKRDKIRYYTNEDQKRFYPNDRGLEFINALQDGQFAW